MADSSTRTGGAGSWADSLEWDNGIPGADSGIINEDIATFGSGGGAVVVDAYRNLKSFTFDGGAAGWSFNTGTLHLTAGGQIEMINVGSNATNSFTAPIVLQGNGATYSFLNNSTNNSRILSFSGAGGGITGVSTAGNTTTLTWGGTNTSNSNAITSIIGDGVGGGNLALVKTGTGTLTLGGVNTYTGGTFAREGLIRFTASSHLGAAASTLFLGHTTGNANINVSMVNQSADTTITRSVVVQSGNTGLVTWGAVLGGGTWNHVFNGTIVLGSLNGSGHGITLTAGENNNFGTVDFTGVISNPTGLQTGTAGQVRVTGGGNNTVKLSGSNSFTGGLLLDSGKLSFNHGNAPGTGTITVDGGSFNQVGASFSNSRNNAQIWRTNFNITGSSAGLAWSIGSGAINLGDTGADTTRVVTSDIGGGATIGGVISDGTNGTTINFTKAGTGTLTLSGASAYTGATAVTGGILQISGNVNRLPTSTVLSVATGARFNLNGQAQSVAGLDNISDAGGIVYNGGAGATLTITGSGSFAGNLTNGANNLGLTKNTGGIQTLSGSNSYTGATNVSGGTLIAGGSSAPAEAGRTATAANNVTTVNIETDGLVVGQRISGVGIAAGTFIRSINTGADTIVISAATSGPVTAVDLAAYGAVGTGAINVTGGELRINGSTLATQTTTVNGAALSGTGTIAGNVNATGNAVLSSTGTLNLGSALTITNTGNQLTSGTVAVTGLTTVSAAADLAVNGMLTGAVSVAGTLKGTGTTGAVTTTSAGTIAAGNSIGTLNTGTLNMTAGGTFAVEINTGTLLADKVAVTGDLQLAGGTAVLSLIDLGPNAVIGSGEFTLITYTGAWDNGIFAGLADGSSFVFGNNSYTIDYNDSVDGLNAVTLAVPEPAGLSLIGLVGSALLARSRVRKRK